VCISYAASGRGRSVRGLVRRDKPAGKERMKESHIEGVANHDDPESCVGGREGVHEALTGACAGTVLSREIYTTGTPTLLSQAEGNTDATAFARWCLVPRGRRPAARAEPSCARTGRSHGCSTWMARRDASGRPEVARR
jgi:hypothetical protein